MEKAIKSFKLNRREVLFLGFIFLISLFWRLWPKLLIDPHLLTMNADVWERLAMAQYFLDHGHLPVYCLRYITYGNVPFWYPQIGPIFLGILAKISALDLPTVCSRIMPFFEALTPIPFYFLARWLFGRCVGYISTIVLSLTPSFIYWTAITTPTSLTLFLMPIYIMLLLIRAEKEPFAVKQRFIWIAITALLLAVNFLIHLTYFFAIVVILPIALLIFIRSGSAGKKFVDLLAAVLLSQILTIFWWAPHNLYGWWIFHLVTSSGLKNILDQFDDYGMITGFVSVIAFLFYMWKLLRKRRLFTRYDWLPLVWLIIPLIETQSETILKLFHRLYWGWYTIIKPLEGFRFFGFLAQPLALIIGWVIGKYILERTKWTGRACFIAALAMLILLNYDIRFPFGMVVRLQNSGLTMGEYQAALWFRSQASEKDRIIADYYRSQMLAGVCGGKVLLGGLFPLRNVNLPYINVPAVVQDDICTIYTTEYAETARSLLRRYDCNYIFLSQRMIEGGNIGSTQCQGFGIKVGQKKFENQRYFREVYNDKKGNRIIKIN